MLYNGDNFNENGFLNNVKKKLYSGRIIYEVRIL